MRPGETMCYYRAKGGQKSIYVTVMYDEEGLRSSIVQSTEMHQPITNVNYELNVLSVPSVS